MGKGWGGKHISKQLFPITPEGLVEVGATELGEDFLAIPPDPPFIFLAKSPRLVFLPKASAGTRIHVKQSYGRVFKLTDRCLDVLHAQMWLKLRYHEAVIICQSASSYD